MKSCVVTANYACDPNKVWLYLTKEFTRRRSLWMVTACVSILACILVSLCLGYPSPPVVSVV